MAQNFTSLFPRTELLREDEGLREGPRAARRRGGHRHRLSPRLGNGALVRALSHDQVTT